MPIIVNFEGCRAENNIPYAEITSQTLDMLLLPAMERRYIARYGRQPSPNTWRGWYDALRSYFHYLHSTGRIEINSMLALQKPDCSVDAIDHLTPEEDEALAACPKSPLEEAVIGLAREAGLRAEEICDLADCDVDLDRGFIRVRKGKTNASRRGEAAVRSLLPGEERVDQFGDGRHRRFSSLWRKPSRLSA
jgi:site-specific recombinase XerD